ncbi:hypothetical protein CVT24_000608 [Panaeolus cyanescens]|uniref:Cytochrome P450 n=1 Tax=Panaeolus cyanescens TaxID=181874 RepID=A0A409WBK2_9AGAR|nr:hypothetical protein CVT24_000608 [Panaeolus cyanescens]
MRELLEQLLHSAPFQLFLATIVLWNRNAIWQWIKGLRLPPGPPRRPFTKNLHQIPRSYPWLTYSDWAKQYGPVFSFGLFNKTTIVLNSAKSVNDLLEHKASIYSDRPVRWMGGELAGRKKTIFFMSSQVPEFKEYRRLLQSGLNPRASKSYRPIQIQEVQVLLRGLLETPQDFVSHIRRNAVAVVLKVAYGYQVVGHDDPLVVALENGMKQLGVLYAPGRFLVENFPILRFLPEWFPGAGFKRLARTIGETMSHLEDQPLEWAKRAIASGNFVESFTSKYLRQEDGSLVSDEKLNEWIKWTAEGIFVGGGDTTVSALTSFFYLMVTHPHIQERAQAEIDQVVQGRLPNLDDLPMLPYIKALIKEVLRWAPVAPLGLPHGTVQDSTYDGYYIPKNATVVSNIWALMHDEESYPNPSVFDPERHMGPNPQPDPLKFAFGFGRRSCPGAHFAEMAMFLNITNILAVFKLLKPLDKDGKEEDPKLEWLSGPTLSLKKLKGQANVSLYTSSPTGRRSPNCAIKLDNLVKVISSSKGKLALLAALYYGVIWNRRAIWLWWKGLRLPPGPARQFIIGNKNHLPKKFAWLEFTSWSKTYGPIQSFEVLNKTTILLSSAKAVTDLLELRSINYSGRSDMWMARLAGRGKSLVLMDSDHPLFKKYRGLVQSGLSSKATKTYRPIQTEAAQVLLKGLLDTPQEFRQHIRRNAVAIILKATYGYTMAGTDDPMIKVIEDGLRHSGPINVPGKFLVETIPILRFLPEWFPGAGFKRFAKEVKRLMDPIQNVPFDWAVKNIASGDYVHSYCSNLLNVENGKILNDAASQDAIKWTCSALYIGGGDTVVSALSTFIFLMCLHPDAQKKAQAEIDKAAPHRLPTLDDLDSLPYIVAIIKETVRYGTVVPLGLPHKATADDVYEGYFIPKGATVIPNIWAITHDEDLYPEPFKFDPGRHLGSKPQPDPFKFIFGYGRRVCPGAHFAQMSLFLNAMSILAVFDILKPLDKDGAEYEPKEDWQSGFMLHLNPFDCRIVPRSPDHLNYLENN